MLSVELPSKGEVFFSFDHKVYEPPVPDKPRFTPDIKAVTTCTMRIGAQIFAKAAFCARADNFNKDSGRKIALTRALKMSGLNKAERKAVWLRYFSRDIKNDTYKVTGPVSLRPSSRLSWILRQGREACI